MTGRRVELFGWLTVEDKALAALEWHGGGGGFVADLVSFPTRRSRERIGLGLVEPRRGLIEQQHLRRGPSADTAPRFSTATRSLCSITNAALPDDIRRNQDVRDAYLRERDSQSAEMP